MQARTCRGRDALLWVPSKLDTEKMDCEGCPMRHKVIHLIHHLLRSQMKVVRVNGQPTGDRSDWYDDSHRGAVIKISVNRLGTTPSSAVFSAASWHSASRIASQEGVIVLTLTKALCHASAPTWPTLSHNLRACRLAPAGLLTPAPAYCSAAVLLSETLAIRLPGQPSAWRYTPCCPSHRPPRPFARGLLRCSGCSVGGEIASP
jgi:hypothetical protein